MVQLRRLCGLCSIFAFSIFFQKFLPIRTHNYYPTLCFMVDELDLCHSYGQQSITMASISFKGRLPKLVVFDLDRTLWPFWVDTHVDPPFTKKSNGVLYDRYGSKVTHFPEVPAILDWLTKEGIPLAAASRTGEIDGAEQLLSLWDWNKYFTYKEIYPGCKVTHFNKFKRNSGIQFKDMLFFDDEYRNIVDISKLGVTCVYAERGMSIRVLEEGLQEFAQRRN